MKNVTWKAAESRVGVWLGAKGLGKSGRSPLSGGNSGQTRSDHPHPFIFNECKRDKSYLTASNYWLECNAPNKKLKPSARIPTIVTLPETDDNRVISKTSDIWCFHCDDIQKIVDYLNGKGNVNIFYWKGARPAVLSLYKKTYNIWRHSRLEADRKMELVSVTTVNHGHIGFWIVINKNDIIRFWELVLKARKIRENLLNGVEDNYENINHEDPEVWHADVIKSLR